MEESLKAYARVTAIRAHIGGDVNIVYPEVVAWFEAYQISDNQIRSGGGTGRESLGRMGRGLTCAHYTTRCHASISFRALATCNEGLTFPPDLIVTGKSLTRSKVPLGHVARSPYTITLASWPYALQGDTKIFRLRHSLFPIYDRNCGT